MRRFEPCEQVNMIRHATDTLRNPAQTTDSTADVIVKACPSFQSDPWFAVFCREDDMIKEVGVRPGCVVSWICHPVVSLRSTTGYKLKSLRLEESMFDDTE
jgi:hypothetical protein